jgi:DNA topoisomerase-1
MKIRTNMMTMKKKFLAHNSELKKMESKSDEVKFNEAKELHKYIENIRKRYQKDWIAADDKTKQHAVASYLIDTLALRPGGPNNDDTFGCSTLLVKHVSLTPVNREMSLTFLGKGSVLYDRTISVPDEVFTNLEQFKQDKLEGDKIFDKINRDTLKDYFKKIDGTNNVTCKVIRIYRACVEFEKKLEEYSTGGMTTEEQYKSALIDVTQLLNLRGDNGTEDNLNIAKKFYLDPRITLAWCHKYHVLMESVYSKDLIKQSKWGV